MEATAGDLITHSLDKAQGLIFSLLNFWLFKNFKIVYFLNVHLFIFERERERECKREEGRERGRQRIASRLHTVSAEPKSQTLN